VSSFSDPAGRSSDSVTDARCHESLSWNPGLGGNCTTLFVGWWVCVGVQEQQSSSLPWTATGTANATVPSPTLWTPSMYPTINSSFVPTPIQTGVPQDCQAFYQAQSVGDLPLLYLMLALKRNSIANTAPGRHM
jgi:hypothetical protein